MKKLLLLLLSICIQSNVHSQDSIVNSRDSVITNADFSIGLNLNGGNNPLYGGNVRMNLSKEKGPWEFALNPLFAMNYISVNDNIVLARREGYNTLSISHVLNSKWKIIAFSEVDHSYIRKINLRWNGGFGPGYKWGNKKYEINLSEVILAEGLSTVNNTVSNYLVVRASTRLKLGIKTKFGSFSSISHIQPAIYTNQGIGINEHFILRSLNKIEFIVNRHTTTGFTYESNFQSYPAYLNKNVKRFDWGTSFFILYKIK